MRKEFYITTSISYTNAEPHIGHVLEAVQTDALARWRRIQGDEVFFLTGTDEHGIKVARAAEDAGRTPREFVDNLTPKFEALKKAFDLSWDDFIRTSDKKRHWSGVEKIWRELEEKGDIYEKEYEGLYCVGCETFLTERDLVKGVCLNHKTKPELIKEKNLFFRLSKYGEQIGKAIESGELDIRPETRRNEVLSLVKTGLEDISFSRSRKKLQWGIPVPGHDDQTMYVWCDALSNYVTAIGYEGDNEKFKKWWPADIHVIGKDILRFHAAIWPGMLLAVGLPLPKRIYVHGFVTIEGEKMSKSIGNVIDPIGLVNKYGSDALRYYLLRDIPSDEDGDFSIQRLEERYNADLANGLGNFASRVTALAEGAGEWGGDLGEIDEEVVGQIAETTELVARAIERFKLHEVVSAIWGLIKFGDGYVDKHKPWETGDKRVIGSLVVLLDTIAVFVSPIVPKASEKIKEGIRNKKKIDNLFPRLNA